MSIPGAIRVVVDGEEVRVAAGISVASLLANGGLPARRSVGGEARAALCGMGICHECRVTVDGRAHQRGCMVIAADGMVIERDV